MKDETEHIGSSKKTLRNHLRQVLVDLQPVDLHQRSAQACANLVQTKAYRRAEVVMVFLSLPTEVETTALVLQAWRDRKRVLAPKVNWEQRRMLPIEITSLSDNISVGEHGIREPAQGVPEPLEDIDLVIVPGLGFDEAGNRIGRGRGFYDRFLAHDGWRGVASGLAIEDQVVAEVPTYEHDSPVDMLVTDAKVRIFKKA